MKSLPQQDNISYNINLFNARKKLAIYDGPKADVGIKNTYKKNINLFSILNFVKI